MSEIGFDGNQDLYGIGIRVGYYTTALSLWISHMWAPSEAHFLHPITITFLVAMLVGVSVLSRVPAETFAIEPFMLMQISYYTYFMGLGGPLRPDFLPWERDYPKFFMTRLVGLMLVGYDIWYWYTGIWHMRPSPGVDTFAILLYFGRVNIFQWISIVMRVSVVLLCVYTLFLLADALHQQWWEKRMDHQVPAERLKYLATRWNIIWNQDNAFAALDSRRHPTKHLTPAILRQGSTTSIRSAPATGWQEDSGRSECTKGSLKKELSWRESVASGKSDHTDESMSKSTTNSEPSPRIVRTMTDQIRKTLLGWQPDHPTLNGQPLYEYIPTLEGIATSLDLLESLNDKAARKTYCMRTAALVRTLCTHQVRPRVFAAIRFHIHSLGCNSKDHQTNMIRRALEHPAYSKVQPEDIYLATRIYLTYNKPAKPSGWAYFALVWTSFATCSILVISTELAIQWSAIRGVQDIGSVGQLIPMMIGVCGLLKTCWTALLDRKHGEVWCFGACRGTQKRAAWAAACEAFDQARAAWRRTVHRSDEPHDTKDEKHETSV